MKDSSIFSITNSNHLSFIAERDLGEKLCKYNSSKKYTTYIERPDGDTTRNGFKLMNDEKVNTFLGKTNSEKKW